MPEAPQAVRGLADTMIAKFTPPSFVPGCEVKSTADISEYATDNGWIEAIVGGDNQQRVRYYGTPQGVIVGDFVDVEYFPAYKLYRVFGATLGGTAIAGGLRVNKVWASDFSSESLVTDASDNITINTGTLTLPSDIIHLGDLDTKWSFAEDDVEITVGGLSMLKLTEAGQDLINLGPGSGDVDIDFNGDMFLEGSSGRLGIGTSTIPAGVKLIVQATSDHTRALFGDVTADKFAQFGYQNSGGTWTFANVDAASGNSFNIIRGASTNVAVFATNGDLALGGITTPLAQLHVDQSSTIAAQPVLYLDQADVSEPFIKYVGTAAAATLTQSIVAEADVTTATRQGFVKIEIEDIGNQVTDQAYFVPFYALA